MAEKKIQTRIALKIDTLANWQDIWGTFKPMAGEKILFQIPTDTTLDSKGAKVTGTTPPQVISKTGDGVTVLRDLPWDSAIAADVAAWAKPGDSSYINVSTLKTDVTNLQTAVNTTIPNNYATKELLTQTINGLDSANSGSGNFITAVSQTDGKVTVTKGSKAIADLSDGNRVGTLETNLGTAQTNITNLQTAVKAIQDAPYATEGYVDGAVSGAINALDSTSTGSGNFITAVSQTNGKVTVTKGSKAITDLSDASRVSTLETNVNNLTTSVNTISGDYVSKGTYNAGQKTQDDRLTALEGKIGSVTGAMHFIGAFASAPSKNGTEALKAGDVYINTSNNKEFVYSGSAWVELGDTTAEAQAIANLQTTIPQTYATKTELTNTINGLDGKSSGSGNFITGVSQTDGIVTVTKGSKAITDLSDASRVTTLETNLGTAQTNITNLQTAVKAIQDAPYATTGNVATAKSELIGKSTDAATANTIYGAKKAAANVLGASGDAATANTVYGVKAAVAAEKTRAEQAETNLSTAITTLGKKLTTVSTTLNNGLKVTPTTNSDGAKDYKIDIDTDVIFVFDCGSATVNAQNITK